MTSPTTYGVVSLPVPLDHLAIVRVDDAHFVTTHGTQGVPKSKLSTEWYPFIHQSRLQHVQCAVNTELYLQRTACGKQLHQIILTSKVGK